jgi:RNA polymerase sigma-70 factor (ECF subfamily)
VLSELSLPERMVLVLVYIEERSVAEVARDLGWSIANVKVRAFRSRQKARRILEQFERRSNEEG